MCLDKECNGYLLIDERSTYENYYKNGEFKFDEDGNIDESSLKKYLIYRCVRCNKKFKLTYEKWFELMRNTIAKMVLEVKRKEMMAQLNTQTISEDNGLSYCGQCTGYSGDGYCLNDIIKQCTIRK